VDEKQTLATAYSAAELDASSARMPNAVAARKSDTNLQLRALYPNRLAEARFLTISPFPSTDTSPSMTNKPRHHVQSIDDSYSIYGVDAIWHNQYRGPNSDFVGMRKQFDCDINQLLLQVSKHIESGLYTVITMSASPHSLTVVCGCERMEKDMPDDMWDDPSFMEGDEQ
jgi:hypothetical protein